MDKRILKRIRDLFAMMGSSTPEGKQAEERLRALLLKHGKTWNDLPELLQQGQGQGQGSSASPSPSHDPRDDVPVSAGPDINALDVIHRLLEVYIEMKPHEYVTAALWALHTFVFDRFSHSPRLLLTSPLPGVGKSALLDVLNTLVPRPHLTDSITAAGIYYQVHTFQSTMLIDEADNLDLAAKGALIAVLNSGHRRGRRITRYKASWRTWAPMAIAGITTPMKPSTLQRCIILNMARKTRDMRRYDENDLQELHKAYSMGRAWAQDVMINTDPTLPEIWRNRAADNWRPLIAIADTFGPVWGDRAREASIEYAKSHPEENMVVLLLRDIRKVFYQKHSTLDYFPSSYLVGLLRLFEGSPWSEWCGVQDNQIPHELSQGELAKLLRPFKIKPRTVWWPNRQGTSVKGYYRTDFEGAWRSYCDDTPTQQHSGPTNVRHLHDARKGGRS
jgi:Protein of unknown function (DUF3631)